MIEVVPSLAKLLENLLGKAKLTKFHTYFKLKPRVLEFLISTV